MSDEDCTYNHIRLKPGATVRVKHERIGQIKPRQLVDLLEQEPLGDEFEAVWDANRATLYES
jgi:hypothetical protein